MIDDCGSSAQPGASIQPSRSLVRGSAPCAECSENTATLFCSDCNVDFCETCCKMVHRPRILSSHQIGPISAKPRPIPKCVQHDECVSLFCLESSCRIPICSSCVRHGAHRSHATRGLLESLTEQHKSVESEFERCQQTLSELQQRSALLRQLQVDLQAQRDLCLDRLDADFEHVLASLTALRLRLRGSLLEHVQQRAEVLRALTSETDTFASELVDTQQQMREALVPVIVERGPSPKKQASSSSASSSTSVSLSVVVHAPSSSSSSSSSTTVDGVILPESPVNDSSSVSSNSSTSSSSEPEIGLQVGPISVSSSASASSSSSSNFNSPSSHSSSAVSSNSSSPSSSSSRVKMMVRPDIDLASAATFLFAISRLGSRLKRSVSSCQDVLRTSADTTPLEYALMAPDDHGLSVPLLQMPLPSDDKDHSSSASSSSSSSSGASSSSPLSSYVTSLSSLSESIYRPALGRIARDILQAIQSLKISPTSHLFPSTSSLPDLVVNTVISLEPGVVHRFGSVVVTSCGYLTVAAWDGQVGGSLRLVISGELRIENGGRLDLSGRGYRGGQPSSASENASQQGESSEGLGASSCAANGGGGGGGRASAKFGSVGGGGGGLGTAGAPSEPNRYTGKQRSGGSGGAINGVPETAGEARSMGCGGGAGSGYLGSIGGCGGSGGGALYIEAHTLDNRGQILCNGLSGAPGGGAQYASGGGGGAGGTVRIIARDFVSIGYVQAQGGRGGAAGHCGPCPGICSAGGAGGDGRIVLEQRGAVSSSTSSSASLLQLPQNGRHLSRSHSSSSANGNGNAPGSARGQQQQKDTNFVSVLPKPVLVGF